MTQSSFGPRADGSLWTVYQDGTEKMWDGPNEERAKKYREGLAERWLWHCTACDAMKMLNAYGGEYDCTCEEWKAENIRFMVIKGIVAGRFKLDHWYWLTELAKD